MPELSITAADAHAYDVTVTGDDGSERVHHVSVPEDWLAGHGLAASQEPALVRATLQRLIDDDPAAALPATFSLADLERRLPSYPEEILGLI